jgi:ABC-type lipoprotein export system ATPase subunit
MALLEGHNLRKTYRLGRRNVVEALRGVDVAIESGEMVAIVGPSGSGKSTLMHILGLLHAPDAVRDEPAPRLTFGGRDMVRLGDRERTRIRGCEMGFVFQDFNLVPTLTTVENVMLACEYAGVTGRTARESAIASLARVGLAERAGHRPAELSGGEQQRVALARALVNRPRLVLADEPTGNLDSDRASAREARERAEALLVRVGLGDRLQHRPGTLSGGEQQRVALARALVTKPSLLLADEPTGDLDAQTASHLHELLREMHREHGLTSLIATHNPSLSGACDRVLRLIDGRLEPA